MELQSFDSEYVRRLVANDPATQDHFATYFNELLGVKLRARLRSFEDVMDIRQETLARVLHLLRNGALQHPERLGAFVNSVCNNVLLEHYRGEGRTTPLEDACEPVCPAPNLDARLIAVERQARVRQVLDELPARDRNLLRAVLEEKDKDKICADFGVTRNYLRVLLHRAVESARRLGGEVHSVARRAQ